MEIESWYNCFPRIPSECYWVCTIRYISYIWGIYTVSGEASRVYIHLYRWEANCGDAGKWPCVANYLFSLLWLKCFDQNVISIIKKSIAIISAHEIKCFIKWLYTIFPKKSSIINPPPPNARITPNQKYPVTIYQCMTIIKY